MTEKTVESGQDQGAVELPKPSYQDKPVAEQTSGAASSVTAESIAEIVKAEVERAVQSTKDKRFDKVERTYGDLSEIQGLLEAVKGGQDPKELLGALEIKNMKDEIAQLRAASSQPAPIPGKSGADEAYEKAKAIISKAELNNNPRILEALGSKYKDPSEMLTAVNMVVLEEVTGKPRATDASKISSSSSNPPSAQRSSDEFDSLLEPSDVSGINLQGIIDAARNLEE